MIVLHCESKTEMVYNNEKYLFIGKNGRNENCYYPENGDKDHFIHAVSSSNITDCCDSPNEKYFVQDGIKYCCVHAMH